ncbi:putative mucin/carbohydrate-binding domain-containing protein [Bacillus mobilis]|uniref:putative mucin/carbohydrate-binding domain-containing protein n=1 Tax=Bacillus mobilis TaxID=2026190 RepID=UPI002FD7ADB0
MKKHPKYKKQALAVITACSVMTTSGLEVFAEGVTTPNPSKNEVSTKIKQENQLDTLENRVSEVKQQEINSIKEATWISNAGISKGEYHDRQDLGFILKEKTPLKVRQINPDFKGKLKLRLLSNDSREEKAVDVGSNWVTIQADTPLVPFIDTPYGVTNARLEYQVESNQVQKPLPVYQEGGNVEQFFKIWDQYDGDHALIKGKSFQLFIPKKDKGLVKNLKDFKSLDELITYLEEIFVYNNKIIGLDNSTPTDKPSENRYFLKADADGAGGAYYGSNWTANSYDTTDMWFTKGSWGTLHEIAHGYQSGFDDQGMYTGEVSNNLFGVQYQYEKYGKEADRIGWLFDYGKKDKVEKNLYNALIKNNGSYDSVNLREKLILLTMLKQKAGNEAFTKMYQGYRKEANQTGFNAADYRLPDLMNHYYSENSGYDFTATLQRWKLSLDPIQAEINRAKGYQAVASLADIVPESQLVQAKELVDRNILINSNFEMVKNEEIAPLQLKANLKIQLNTQNIEAFRGETIQLKEGKKIIKEMPIEGNTISFTDVPNGIYTLTIPDGKSGKYQMDEYYAYVKEKENTLNVKLEKIEASNLANQKIRFLGLGDRNFAEFQTNLNSHFATFNIIDENPHSYYEGEKYASLQVIDDIGRVIYTKELQGTNAAIGNDTIPLEMGYKITIYHAEVKNRLTNSEKIIDSKNKTNNFVVTKWGLENTTLHNNTEENIMKKIDDRAQLILTNPDLVSMKHSEMKNHLWVAIDSLSDPHRTNYFNKYQEIFPSINTNEILDGNQFSWSMQGIGDWEFANINFNKSAKEMNINLKAGTPHNYFDETYASIKVQKPSGQIVYNKEIYGDKKQNPETNKISVEVGDFIELAHKEGKDRATFINKENNKQENIGDKMIYKVTHSGLEKLVF